VRALPLTALACIHQWRKAQLPAPLFKLDNAPNDAFKVSVHPTTAVPSLKGAYRGGGGNSKQTPARPSPQQPTSSTPTTATVTTTTSTTSTAAAAAAAPRAFQPSAAPTKSAWGGEPSSNTTVLLVVRSVMGMRYTVIT
jgi:hypothetical protein